VLAPPSRRCPRPGRSSDTFKRFAFRFQIGLSVVVGGVEADVAEPASDHRDVDTCRNQMHSGSVPKAVRRDGLRRQTRRLPRGRSGVLGKLKAYARGAKWSTIAVDEECFVASSRLTFQ
jgi:protein strawberry notch